MTEFDNVVSRVRDIARLRAIEDIEKEEAAVRLVSGRHQALRANFSESDKNRYIESAQDRAVDSLRDNLIELAFGPRVKD